MRHKCILTVTVALIGATSALSQTSTNQVLNSLPSRVLGHPNPEQLSNVVTFSPNLVEGRELYQPQGIAVDTTSNPPVLYVSDTLNNRVLAWKNATSFNNGAPADMVIGQTDRFSTLAHGPGTSLVTGFAFPSGLAIDKAGSLYVVDSGNNRILRFPKPFAQTQNPVIPDMVLGQPNLNSRTPNNGKSLSQPVAAEGIFTANTDFSSLAQASVAFDSSGNLWFTDTNNSRVLRYPAASLPKPDVSNTTGNIKADLAIGQPNLTSLNTVLLNAQPNAMQKKDQFGVLSSLGFDPAGRLFVLDDFGDGATAFGRVLVFTNPNSLASGSGAADRIMGVVPAGEATALGLTGTAFNTFFASTVLDQPDGIFFLDDGAVCILDTLDNRIMMFPPYQSWDPESKYYSPVATSVIGQGGATNFLTTNPNNAPTATIASGTPPASGNTFWAPTAGVFLTATKELFLADRANNRVIVMPYTGGTFQSATRVLGQDKLTTNSPNLIEGREFQFTSDAGIALDTTGPVPHLYIADTYNNRVLGYFDARLVTAGKPADLVLGQPDFTSALCNVNSSAANGLGGDATLPTQSSLCTPTGLAVDPSGNLYVADTSNGRVLRFHAPFAGGPKGITMQPADLVLGQTGFSAQIKQPNSTTMVAPYGLAFSGNNGLVVSDAVLNRVLYIPFTANGTFNALTDNGKAATKVYGQSDFNGKNSGTGAGSLNRPLHVASDAEGRVYVADSGNNRVSVFADPNSQFNPSGIQATVIPVTSSPRGVFINPITDEIWIARTGSNDCVRYAPFNNFFAGATFNFQVPAVSSTLAVAQDSSGAIYVADASNRVAIYYPAVQSINGANFLASRPLAPGMIASLCGPTTNCTDPNNTSFGAQTKPTSYTGFPAPFVLADLQVSVNGAFAPLFYVSPSQINFYVPSSAPTSGSALIEVSSKTTGQVIAAGQAQMSNSSPGIFMQNFDGATRQASVLNEDNSINSASNPAQRGHLIQIYATGQGVFPGWPADGQAASGSPLSIVPGTLTQVLIGTCLLSEGATAPLGCPNQPGDVTPGSGKNWIPFSGLAPNYAGLWQINAQIPMAVAPNAAAIIKVLISGIASTDPATSAPYQTVVYVK